ncbi:FAD binding domain-containing protein [Phlyctema vagabunda]|uniref:FAD binding domain-containing protein n=1 Tax=Phlyctema vagabunda TaxID=108571 RepID=A0ABR4PNM7_9HELO
MVEKTTDFKVVIVGGSIAGLTLAHCLQQSGIDFVVLEAHGDIAPQVGASIGILPNGARILDQLGVWEAIDKLIIPLHSTEIWTGSGELILSGIQAAALHDRFGYPVAFLDRQLVLRALADKIADPSKIKVGAKVLRVDHSEHVVIVHCKDGTSYAGDFVAGADGVHSTIRQEMWRHADRKGINESIQKDKTAMTSEYRCLFGISNPVPGMHGAITHRTFAEGWSSLVILGKNERCFWFLFEKLDRRYQANELPRFTQEDKEKFVSTFRNRHVNGRTRFNALWKEVITSHLVCLEEAQHETWTLDRFVCLGDSIHKMTPNMGQGGNSAIESAAALANQLVKLQTSEGKTSLAALKFALQNYQHDRQSRVGHISTAANDLTRLEAMKTFKDKVTAKYLLKYMGDLLLEKSADSITGAPKIDFLPEPKKALAGNAPFQPDTGIGHKESKLRRCLYAMPLLLVTWYVMHLFADLSHRTGGFAAQAYVSGAVPSIDGNSTTLRSTYYGNLGIDAVLKRYVLVFTPSIANIDQTQRYQMMAFMADLIPMQAIWAIESARLGNFMTLATISRTVLECIYQWRGIAMISPVYFFLHYVQNPQENYHAAGNRIVPASAAKAIIVSIILGYVIPTFFMFSTLLSITSRQLVNAIWQTFPIWTLLISYATKGSKQTDQVDAKMISNYSLSTLRFAYILSGSLSAAVYVYIHMTSSFPLLQIFFNEVSSPHSAISSFVQGFGRFLRYDQIFAFGSGLFWLILNFKDLKTANKLHAGWHKIVGVLGATTILFGPGASMALGWAWREEVMAGTKWAVAKTNTSRCQQLRLQIVNTHNSEKSTSSHNTIQAIEGLIEKM